MEDIYLDSFVSALDTLILSTNKMASFTRVGSSRHVRRRNQVYKYRKGNKQQSSCTEEKKSCNIPQTKYRYSVSLLQKKANFMENNIKFTTMQVVYVCYYVILRP